MICSPGSQRFQPFMPASSIPLLLHAVRGNCHYWVPARCTRRRGWTGSSSPGACGPRWSIPLVDVPVRMLRFDVVAALLPLRELDLLARNFLVGHVVEDVPDDVEAATSLVVGPRHVPRCMRRIRGGEHV